MLGETQGTSAGGAEEAGKFLRVPGTNPFLPDDHDHQGNRFLELMGEHQLDVYLMNTGRVGGADDDERSEKVRIPHSSAIVKGDRRGHDRVGRGPGLRLPGRHSRCRASRSPTPRCCARASSTSRQGRQDEYAKIVDTLKGERVEFLQKFPALSTRSSTPSESRSPTPQVTGHSA